MSAVTVAVQTISLAHRSSTLWPVKKQIKSTPSCPETSYGWLAGDDQLLLFPSKEQAVLFHRRRAYRGTKTALQRQKPGQTHAIILMQRDGRSSETAPSTRHDTTQIEDDQAEFSRLELATTAPSFSWRRLC